MRRTTAISLIFAALLAGIALGRFGFTIPVWMVAAATIGALVICRTRLFTLGLIILALTLGLWRTEVYLAQQGIITDLVGQKIVAEGIVADDPSFDPRGFIVFKLGELKLNGQAVPGDIQIRMYQTNMHRGYQVHAEGKLRAGFGNTLAELSYPKLQIVSMQQSWLEQIRQKFFVGMKTALAEPMASFGLGLLVGIRSLIPKDMAAQLSLVGLSHLVAVSGYNLTIIVTAAHRLLERFGRGIALISSLWLIGGFLLVTGASASIVRASFVSVLALFAAFYGRRFDAMAIILLTAGLTAIYKPAYLSDLGWLLSYLAFFGIMILAPALQARLGNPKNILVKLFIESSAAQIMTVPLILFFFGELSIVAPFTNLIILPMVPLAMLLGFVAGLAGMIAPAFAGWLAWPADLLLRFMLGIVQYAADLPWAGTTFKITLVSMLVMYGLIIAAIVVMKRINQRSGAIEEYRSPLVEPGLSTKIPG